MWTREATSALIQHYQANECLWMTTSPLYRNKTKRIEALHKIATEVCKYRPQSTPEDIKNKINGIRTQYVSEINKLILASKKGEQYEPTLWCFEILSFLKPFTQPKQRPPNNWNRSVMPKPLKPSFTTNKSSQQSSVTLPTNNRHFQSHFFNEDLKEDCILVKSEPEHEIENDIEIIEEEDTLITDDEIGSPMYNNEEDKQLKEDTEEKSLTTHTRKSPIYMDSGTEESSDEQRIQRLLSPSRINSEITLVSRKELTKRKEEFQENETVEKKRRLEETKMKEEEDRIQIFGKFVMSQMRTVTNHVLLIKLEHTIQNAIIEAQLKQIELDEQKIAKEGSST